MNQSDAANSARPARPNQAEKERFIAWNNLYLPYGLPPTNEREVIYA
jgi:hypothetical protein